MKKALIGAAALTLMLPHAAMAAQDGQSGATSTGSFDVTLTVSPPVLDTVQILYLDDLDFGSIPATPAAVSASAAQSSFFCLQRSTPGHVRVTVSQNESINFGNAFGLKGQTDSNNDGIVDFVQVRVEMFNPGGISGVSLGNGGSYTMVQNGSGCNAASGASVANEFRVKLLELNSGAESGQNTAFAQTFTLTASVP